MYSGSSIKRNLKTKSKLSNTIERTSVSQIILQSINYGSKVLRGLAFRVLRGYNFLGVRLCMISVVKLYADVMTTFCGLYSARIV